VTRRNVRDASRGGVRRQRRAGQQYRAGVRGDRGRRHYEDRVAHRTRRIAGRAVVGGGGEFIAVSSQRELLAAATPDEAAKPSVSELDVSTNELALVYRVRGMSAEKAQRRADAVLRRGMWAAERSSPTRRPAGSRCGTSANALTTGHDARLRCSARRAWLFTAKSHVVALKGWPVSEAEPMTPVCGMGGAADHARRRPRGRGIATATRRSTTTAALADQPADGP
jgi:hypothetical protein